MRFGIVHGSSADVLDPGQVLNGMLSAMHYAVTNTLTEVEAGGPLVPKLAVEWDASPDARVWIFKLRPGIKFHNGKTLTVDDVIASINHHRGEGSTSSAKTLVDAVVDITSDGADRLTIELNSGDADFLFKLSSFNFPIYAARGDGSLAFEKGVGLGAYKLINFEPGVRAAFEKNRNYWDDTRGHFDSAELISIRDVTACTNALRTDNDGLVDQCNCGLAMWGADHASSSSPPPLPIAATFFRRTRSAAVSANVRSLRASSRSRSLIRFFLPWPLVRDARCWRGPSHSPVHTPTAMLRSTPDKARDCVSIRPDRPR